MRLKNLELFGFKSFADRTTFTFDVGATAIVGPNGCGKSNVVDAVKWVLGEQSVRSLRGREMLDVLFNGTDRRPASGFAEATLTFDNTDGTLAIDAAEVSVTRRLYRSGDSEYLINRQSRRLRDIRELFMGTGLGPGGYSFMEQGKIDSILAVNPVDRRRVFEEAAGISLFGARRHETELKLDKLEANLLRLADIVDELERQQRSLKIQANKAERFQELSAGVSRLQAQVALHRYDVNAKRMVDCQQRLEELKHSRETAESERGGLRAAVEAADAVLDERSDELATLREGHAGVVAREMAAHDVVQLHEAQVQQLERRAAGRATEIADLEREIETGRSEHGRSVTETEGLEVELTRLRPALDEREAAVAAAEEALTIAEERLANIDSTVQGLAQRRLQTDRQVAGLDADERRWTDERARAHSRLEQVTAEHAAIALKVAALRERHGRLDSELIEHREAARATEGRVEETENGLHRTAESQRATLAENSKLSARIDALEGQINRQEGLESGVKAILDEKRRRPAEFLAGFGGLLLDALRVDLSGAEAIEAALGDLAQAIVVADLAEALEGARFLANSGKGRAYFVPAAAFAAQPTKLPAGVTALNEAAARIMSALLEGVEVRDIQTVEGMVRSGAVLPRVLVTPDGAVVREGRVVMSGRKGNHRGLVAVRSELDVLRLEAEKVRVDLVSLDAAMRQWAQERHQAREAARVAAAQLTAAQGEWNRLEHEVRGLSGQSQRIEDERGRLDELLQAARVRLEEVLGTRSGVQTGFESLLGDLRDAESERAAVLSAAREGRARRDLLASAREQARVALVTAEQRRLGLSSSTRHLRDRLDKAVRSIERAREELGTSSAERTRTTGLLEEERRRVEGLSADVATFRERIDRSAADVAELTRGCEELKARSAALEHSLESIRHAWHAAEVKHSELRVAQESLVENVRGELHLDLEAMHREYAPADVEWSAVEAELQEVRERIKKLGNINMAAIDDLKDVEERLLFLTAQRADLLSSKQQLSRVLNDIASESTRLFLDTFNRVREHFQETFRRLFNGGKADIALLDEENPLESGIEIVARPPGKKMQTISLLSGGERTMTAVALLFSIIKAHPCPCCLLDEVDAALDEDNTERFSVLLNEFIGGTQFILITHSRRTMAKATALFGVTMAERGVSRHVAVRFEEVREDGSFEIRLPESGARDATQSAETAVMTKRRRAQPSAGILMEDRGSSPDAEETPPAAGGSWSANGNGHGGAVASTRGEVIVDIASAAQDEAGTDPDDSPRESGTGT